MQNSGLMGWHKVGFKVDSSLVEPLNNFLDAFLAQAITTENAGDDDFFEAAFPKTPDWKSVYITALFDDRVDVEPIIEFIQKNLATDKEIPVTCEKLVDQNWERVWLKQFSPIKVGTELWVCPSWCEPTQANERNIILDPGLAFGTGTHPTTKMCLQWISNQDLSNKTVLDYGCGSGILAIASIFSGASHAFAVDIDPLAVSACKENAKINKVEEQLTCKIVSELGDQKFDLVIANILADTIIELKTDLLRCVKQDSTLLLSGILSRQAERVIAAFEDKIDFSHYLQPEQSLSQQQEWSLLIGTRHV